MRWSLQKWLAAQSEAGQGYIVFYPSCHPTGLAAVADAVRKKAKMNREFWKGLRSPEGSISEGEIVRESSS